MKKLNQPKQSSVFFSIPVEVLMREKPASLRYLGEWLEEAFGPQTRRDWEAFLLLAEWAKECKKLKNNDASKKN